MAEADIIVARIADMYFPSLNSLVMFILYHFIHDAYTTSMYLLLHTYEGV